MSWFSSNKYPHDDKQITTDQVKKLTSSVNLQTLSFTESVIITDAIIEKRGSDGDISLYQVYEVLNQLKNEGKISKYDRDGIMKRFKEYFEE